MKPKLFIASSVEGLSIGYALQANLQRSAEITVWDQGVFGLSTSALQSLVQALSRFDFGAFIFSPDDLVTMRGETHQAARDNVIFELGLFAGQLGPERCFILAPQDAGDLHFPTDLLGMEPARYETGRSDKNWRAATGPPCDEIRGVLESRGRRLPSVVPGEGGSPESAVRASPGPTEPLSADVTSEPAAAVPTPNWIIAALDDRPSDAVKELEVAIEGDQTRDGKLFLGLWKAHFQSVISIEEGELAYLALASANPEDPTPWVDLVTLLLGAGFPLRALSASENGLRAQPQSIPLRLAKARSLRALQRQPEAEALLEASLREVPSETAVLLVELAKIKNEAGDAEGALETLERGGAATALDVPTLALRAHLLFAQRDYSASIVPYRQLETLKPLEPAYPTLMGNSLLEMECFDLALEAYRRADKLAEGKEAWIVANIGNILNRRGFFAFGSEYLQRSLEIDPNSDYSHERLAGSNRMHTAEQERLETLLKASAAARLAARARKRADETVSAELPRD